jgi:hypothetical protein
MTYGATVVSCKTRDRSGGLADVALGFSELSSYVSHSAYFGAVIGRYANRSLSAGSRSMVASIRLQRTTVRIICTAALEGSTSTSGPHSLW